MLDELIAQSVVLRDGTGPAGLRYRMLDTVAAYGAEWLSALGDTPRLRRRHRDWQHGAGHVVRAGVVQPPAGGGGGVRGECAAEPAGGAGSCAWRCRARRTWRSTRAGTLWFYWVGCGRLSEGRHWLDRAVALESGHEDARLKALWVLGYVAILQGDGTAAVGALHECGERAERVGHARWPRRTPRTGRVPGAAVGRHAGAQELLGRALAAYRELGELNSQVLMGQVELAITKVFQGDLEAAVALCGEVREVCEERGERWTRAYALYVLAYAAWTRATRSRRGSCSTSAW